MREAFLDRDFFETKDGLYFCVIGNVHPHDRVISYLKYAPSSSRIRTIWRKGNVLFNRILPFYSAIGVSLTRKAIEEDHPDYLVWDDVLGIEMIEVPRTDIIRRLLPEERINEVISISRDQLDELERETAELVNILSEYSDVPPSSFGVTGSILLKIHNPMYSDIDLVVYGKDNSFAIRDSIKRLIEEDPRFYRPSGEVLEEWARELVRVQPLNLREAMILRGKDKWDRLFFNRRQFSMHPVLREDETPERYGDRIYRGEGLVEIRARVKNNEYSLFMPAVYEVDDVQVTKGPKVEDIREVASFESIYTDIADIGEQIRVFGRLERVLDRRYGKEYHRVVIGSFEAGGRDYIKPERWFTSETGII